MSEPRWDELVEQLQAPEPKTRRRAIRRLAQSRDPRAIPLLRNAYLQDGDDQVRDAAEAALSRFRAMQERAGSRRPALSDRALSRAIALLAILFLGLVAANVAIRALDRDSGDDAARAEVTEPVLTRADLEGSLSEQIALTRAEVARLREYNRLYNETGTVACGAPEHIPAPLDLNAATRRNYEADLTLLADRFAVTLETLASPQARWDQMCAAEEANMLDVVKASAELDQVTLDLNLVEQDLATAMANPAPTFGPSPTPIPPPTQTPQPAAPDGAQPVASPDDAPMEPSPVPATATATLTPTPLPTATPTLTPTPTATPTLPPPNLDYDAVLRELNRRLAVLGDLQRPYNNGMLDMWQRSEQGESVGTLACALDPWPAPYEWAPAERAQLEQPGTADPQLEEAVRLINEALALAQEARAIYEPSCLNQTLASTADQGIPLASQAVENLTAAQQLVDEIRRRLP